LWDAIYSLCRYPKRNSGVADYGLEPIGNSAAHGREHGISLKNREKGLYRFQRSRITDK